MSGKQIHIDLETLATSYNAQILSIGAVCGNAEFYIEVDTSLYDDTFAVSESTREWWVSKGGFKPTLLDLFSPGNAINQLADFIAGVVKQERDFEVWANSPSFDCAILRHHFDQHFLPCPWEFWQERDVRTIKNAAKRLRMNLRERSNPHHALQDAKNQQMLVDSFFKTMARDIGLARDCLEGVWPGLESDQHGSSSQ